METRAINFFEELKEYLKNASNGQVLSDWEKSKSYDKIGPTVDEFLKNSRKFYKLYLENPIDIGLQFSTEDLSPEFSSGFFLTNNLN